MRSIGALMMTALVLAVLFAIPPVGVADELVAITEHGMIRWETEGRGSRACEAFSAAKRSVSRLSVALPCLACGL
jgi:hypothetical protein